MRTTITKTETGIVLEIVADLFRASAKLCDARTAVLESTLTDLMRASLTLCDAFKCHPVLGDDRLCIFCGAAVIMRDRHGKDCPWAIFMAKLSDCRHIVAEYDLKQLAKPAGRGPKRPSR